MTGPVANPYAAPVAELEPAWQTSEFGYRLANPGQRWIGAFLDQLFAILAAVPAIVAAAVFELGAFPVAGIALVVLGPLAVIQFYSISTTGQSLGKKICKTRIVRLDGSPPGFLYGVVMRAWLFWAASAIPGIGSAIGLVDALLVFRADRRCLHDQVAGTRVIQI